MRQTEISGIFATDRAAFIPLLTPQQKNLSALFAGHHARSGNLPFQTAFSEPEENVTESSQAQQQQGIQQQAFL